MWVRCSPCPQHDIEIGVGRAGSEASDDQTVKTLVFQVSGKLLRGRFASHLHHVSPGRVAERLRCDLMFFEKALITRIKQWRKVGVIGYDRGWLQVPRLVCLFERRHDCQ